MAAWSDWKDWEDDNEEDDDAQGSTVNYSSMLHNERLPAH